MTWRTTPPDVAEATRRAAGDDVYHRFRSAYRTALKELDPGTQVKLSGLWQPVGSGIPGRVDWSTHPFGLAKDFTVAGASAQAIQRVLLSARRQNLYAEWKDEGTGLHLHLGAPSPALRDQAGRLLPGINPAALRFFGGVAAATRVFSLLTSWRRQAGLPI